MCSFTNSCCLRNIAYHFIASRLLLFNLGMAEPNNSPSDFGGDDCILREHSTLFFFGGLSELGVSKDRGTPKSSILVWFSIINHPFWGSINIIFGNTLPLLWGRIRWLHFFLKPGQSTAMHRLHGGEGLLTDHVATLRRWMIFFHEFT